MCRMRSVCALALFGLAVGGSSQALAASKFKDLVGPVTVGAVSATATQRLPILLWGADYGVIHANGGGKSTSAGSLFAAQGLAFEIVSGDDFLGQVRDYLSGKTPWLRATYPMAMLASELLSADPRTVPVPIVLMSFSIGDHVVVKPGIERLGDLRGKTIAIQTAGPHVGLIGDILATAHLEWTDVKIMWVKDLTASADSPAEFFRKNPNVDACTVITPDMLKLTGGLNTRGSGAEGTIKGAHVLMSTATLSRSTPDLYFLRKDYYDSHKDVATKFAGAYLKAVEDLGTSRKADAPGFRKVLQQVMALYPKGSFENEEDAKGLFDDCELSGYPGNVRFFTDKDDLTGLEEFNKAGVRLAVAAGYAGTAKPYPTNDLRWEDIKTIGKLTKTDLTQKPRFNAEAAAEDIEKLNRTGGLDEATKYSFTIPFEPNQDEFSPGTYGAKFEEAIALAAKYQNGVITIKGHSDSFKAVATLIDACLKKGVFTKTNVGGAWHYYLKGSEVNLASMPEVQRHIQSGACDGGSDVSPRQVVEAAKNLSKSRSDNVRKALIAYAATKGVRLDPSQITTLGVGVSEPIIAFPRSKEDAVKNMRVEFLLVAVDAESVKNPYGDY